MKEKILLSLTFGILLLSIAPAMIEFIQSSETTSNYNTVLPFGSATVFASSNSDSTILSFSSSTTVSSFSATTTTGNSITLDIFETNDGTTPLTDPIVTSDNSLCNPVFVDGDVNNDGILDPGEQWHYTCDVVSTITGIFGIILTGFGTAPDNTVITWPGDPEERIVSTVEVVLDTDGDGIADSVDLDPFTFSSQFSDISLGGTTFGDISFDDQTLTVLEAANPIGVLISASPLGGTNPAIVSDCNNGANYSLSPLDAILLTCSSSDIAIIQGPVEVEYYVDGEDFATTTLQTGDAVTFEQDTLTFTNNGEGIVELIVNGETVLVNPDETITLPNDAPRILKQNARDELSALVVTDKRDQKRIDRADKAIGQSLDDRLWEDDYTLTKHGKKVFDKEKKAVRQLSKVQSVDVSDIIEALVNVDKSLAQYAIDSIPTDTGDKKIDKQLAKANKEMKKGQEHIEEGEPDQAINHYKKAWKYAQDALKRLGSHD